MGGATCTSAPCFALHVWLPQCGDVICLDAMHNHRWMEVASLHPLMAADGVGMFSPREVEIGGIVSRVSFSGSFTSHFAVIPQCKHLLTLLRHGAYTSRIFHSNTIPFGIAFFIILSCPHFVYFMLARYSNLRSLCQYHVLPGCTVLDSWHPDRPCWIHFLSPLVMVVPLPFLGKPTCGNLVLHTSKCGTFHS